MNREVHVRFRERFRGEIPLYLLDDFCQPIVKFTLLPNPISTNLYKVDN